MFKKLIVSVGLLLLTLAACSSGSQNITPTQAPTQVPPTATAQQPAAVPPPTDELRQLRANAWQWVSLTTPQETVTITDPARYRVTFNSDASLAVTADCNTANGSYQGESGQLTIEIEAQTKAACPPGSRSDQFITLLGSGARYHFADGKLYIDLKADGGTLTFTPEKESAVPSKPTTSSTLPADLTDKLDRWLQSLIATNPSADPAQAAPGLVLLVDTPQGRYLSAAGVSSIEKGTPLQPTDRLEIGSISKSFTMVVLMQLQEEGVLSLDDPLSKWLPEWAAKIPNGEQFTLRQLAQHVTGIWDYGDPIMGEANDTGDVAAMEKGYRPEELIQWALDHGQPDFKPGEKWKYSNTGYILLGLVAEKASGQKLSELLQKRIFDPLGMKTAHLIESIPQPDELTSNGYWFQKDGTRLNTTRWNGSQAWAAGALAMSVADLATYSQALAAGQLFKNAASLAQMQNYDQRALNVVGAPYGLALMDYGDGYWGHAGETSGFQSLWLTNPSKGITIIGISNSARFSEASFRNVLYILNQGSPLPLSAGGLMTGFSFPAIWSWEKTINSTAVTATQPIIALMLSKNGDAKMITDKCSSYAQGTFTVDTDQHISFKFDAPDAACKDPGDAAELLEVLSMAPGVWRFENGSLVIELPDGRTLWFKNVPF